MYNRHLSFWAPKLDLFTGVVKGFNYLTQILKDCQQYSPSKELPLFFVYVSIMSQLRILVTWLYTPPFQTYPFPLLTPSEIPNHQVRQLLQVCLRFWENYDSDANYSVAFVILWTKFEVNDRYYCNGYLETLQVIYLSLHTSGFFLCELNKNDNFSTCLQILFVADIWPHWAICKLKKRFWKLISTIGLVACCDDF